MRDLQSHAGRRGTHLRWKGRAGPDKTIDWKDGVFNQKPADISVVTWQTVLKMQIRVGRGQIVGFEKRHTNRADIVAVSVFSNFVTIKSTALKLQTT